MLKAGQSDDGHSEKKTRDSMIETKKEMFEGAKQSKVRQ